MLARSSPHERLEIRLVIERLTEKFSACHPAGHVADSYHTFDGARVREFVPLLTERRAHRELAGTGG